MAVKNLQSGAHDRAPRLAWPRPLPLARAIGGGRGWAPGGAGAPAGASCQGYLAFDSPRGVRLCLSASPLALPRKICLRLKGRASVCGVSGKPSPKGHLITLRRKPIKIKFLSWGMFTITEILALVVPFIFGLLIGVLIRRLIGVALVLFAILILAVALGYLSPSAAISILQSLGYTAYQAAEKLGVLKSMIPFSSLTFIIGLIIGLLIK
ncbi:conserved hypothetical protein [Thermoproteus tenax Kra 1]|uniref:Uncharacterized protein n=2 Tax=Thermoproteus tenax TaxID=2271 RepID=G4RKD0_THETK|nr:conserved hypothetical protein [Thermoproteus tenax Kra 1]